MKNTYEIEFVEKSLTQAGAQKVTFIGGRLSSGTCWKISAQEAIENIQSGMAGYFLRNDNGPKEFLVLGIHPLDGIFLTLKGDQRDPKRLLKLAENAMA